MKYSICVFSANYNNYVAVMLTFTAFKTDIKKYVVKHCLKPFLHRVLMYEWQFYSGKKEAIIGAGEEEEEEEEWVTGKMPEKYVSD